MFHAFSGKRLEKENIVSFPLVRGLIDRVLVRRVQGSGVLDCADQRLDLRADRVPRARVPLRIRASEGQMSALSKRYRRGKWRRYQRGKWRAREALFEVYKKYTLSQSSRLNILDISAKMISIVFCYGKLQDISKNLKISCGS